MLGRAATNFSEDRGTQMAASISYYALFALFPLTLLGVAIFGIVLRDADVQERVLAMISEGLPLEEETVGMLLGQAARLGPTVSVVSFFGAIWSAGALSAAIRNSLNAVFGTRRKRPMLRAKLVDFVLLPVIAIPLLGGIVLTTLWRIFQRELDEEYGLLDGRLAWTWEVGAFFIPLLMSFIAFAALYRIAPNRSHPWRYIAPGALLAALAFEGLKAGFGLYLENVFNESIYGSLGSVIVLLFWVYLTSNILIFGAEVASEFPHVLKDEPRHGDQDEEEGDWRRAVLRLVQSLVMVQDDDEPEDRRPDKRAERRAHGHSHDQPDEGAPSPREQAGVR